MATDDSQPRNRLILILAVGTLATLFALKFVFDSYFIGMMEGEAKAKQAQPEELWKLRDEEKKKLEGSPVPIAKAMSDLASKGREGSPLIAPQPSDDTGPMVGWSLGARAQQGAPEGHSAAPTEGAPADEHEAGDAGAAAPETNAASGDAGAAPQNAPAPAADAGHQHP